MSTRACALLLLFHVLGCICLQEPVLYACTGLLTRAFILCLDVSVSVSLSVYKSMCCTCAGLSTRAILLTPDVSATACLQEPMLKLYLCFCASPGCICPPCAVPVRVCWQELLCCTRAYLSTWVCASPARACKSYRLLCFPWTCLQPTRTTTLLIEPPHKVSAHIL